MMELRFIDEDVSTLLTPALHIYGVQEQSVALNYQLIDKTIDESLDHDVVYFPLETQILKVSKARGSKVINGFFMFVFQEKCEFEIFTGQEADEEGVLSDFEDLRTVG